MTRLLPVLIPDHPDSEALLTMDQQWDLALMNYRTLVLEVGEEEAQERTHYWQEFYDENGELLFPDEDPQILLENRFIKGFIPKKITLMRTKEDVDEFLSQR